NLYLDHAVPRHYTQRLSGPRLDSNDHSAVFVLFFFQAEDGIRDPLVTGVQTCALPISARPSIPSIRLIMFVKATSQSTVINQPRSEERRVGKECRSRRVRCN